MTTIDPTYEQYPFREGMTVYGSDGDKVGKIVAIDPAYVVVEKGFFFPTDYYIPVSAIATATDNEIYLTVSKKEALDQDWAQEPAATGYATNTAYATDVTDATDATNTAYATDATEAARIDDRDRVAVPVHEEELEAVKHERDLGAIRIEKDIVTEERTMEVPVTVERLRVRHVPANEAVPTDAITFDEGVIEVPLRGEEIEVQKHAKRTGEVIVEKEAVQHTERVGGTVRREQVRVDGETVQGTGIVDDTGREAPR
jgi:uncharacterized protein (TIGR02271 family)